MGTAAVNYTYDAANRLIRVTDELSGAVMAEYGYDPFGRRLWKEVAGTRAYFLYADEGLVAEYDANGNELRRYGYQPDSIWGTNPLWLKQNGQYYWYQNDHLGTPQKLVDSSGTVVWEARYEAFGKAEVQIETVVNNLRFPGQYYDAETTLHYNWFRYYDPTNGRYTQTDPIGLLGADLNLYVYVWNNPTKGIDPWGLRCVTINIYYNVPGLSPAAIEETNRIFTECFKECKKQQDTCEPTINWPPTDKVYDPSIFGKVDNSYKDLPLGWHGDEVGVFLFEEYDTTLTGQATDPWFEWAAYINRNKIQEYAEGYGWDFDMSTGVCLAHEIGHHVLSRKMGHDHVSGRDTGYVDAEYPTGSRTNQTLSPESCKRLCNKLD